jgi:hypothetical protein
MHHIIDVLGPYLKGGEKNSPLFSQNLVTYEILFDVYLIFK